MEQSGFVLFVCRCKRCVHGRSIKQTNALSRALAARRSATDETAWCKHACSASILRQRRKNRDAAVPHRFFGAGGYESEVRPLAPSTEIFSSRCARARYGLAASTHSHGSPLTRMTKSWYFLLKGRLRMLQALTGTKDSSFPHPLNAKTDYQHATCAGYVLRFGT